MSTDKNKTPQELDQIFKEGLNKLHVPPPRLNQHEDQHPLDEVFKNNFNDLESQPSPRVWENVRSRIPYNLKIKRHLAWWSKVAATLIVGLLATMVLKEYQNRKAVETVSQPIEAEAPMAIPDNSELVYDIEKSNQGSKKQNNEELSARELFMDEEIQPARNIEPIAPLETISESVVSTVENPLNQEQKKSSGKLGEVPIRTINTSDMESLTLKDKDEKSDKTENN